MSSSVLTGVTGLVYWWMKNRLEPLSEWAAINHPLQPWVLKAHILVAPFLVFAVGWIVTDHLLKHIRESRQARRRSGLLATWTLAPMVLSGYLIQTTTQPSWLAAFVWIHLVTGCLFLLSLTAHRWLPRGRSLGRNGRSSGQGTEGD